MATERYIKTQEIIKGQPSRMRRGQTALCEGTSERSSGPTGWEASPRDTVCSNWFGITQNALTLCGAYCYGARWMRSTSRRYLLLLVGILGLGYFFYKF